MNFFNRAVKNITRAKTKTILLALTFFLIGNLVIVGLSVANASESAKMLTRQKMRAVVTYEIDYDAFYKDAEQIEDEDERTDFYNNYPSLKLKEVKDLMNDERIEVANVLTSSTAFTGDGLDYVHLNNEAEKEESNSMIKFEGDIAIDDMVYESPNLFIKANFFPDMIELQDGTYTIVKGRFYSQEEIDNLANVVLVTEEFAKVNGLDVGDEISIKIEAFNKWIQETGVTEDELTMNLEIIGIFNPGSKITPDNPNYDWLGAYENPDNTILMPASTYSVQSLKYQQKSFDHYAELNPEDEYYQNPDNRPSYDNLDEIVINDATILLSDPLDVDDFVKEHSGNLEKYKKLNANNEEFNRLSKPLDTLSMYANFIVWLVVINAIVIITLVVALTLKTREFEIGVLLSLGASKLEIMAQFFVELAIVALLGFTLSVGTGGLISKQVGTALLENQIQEADINEEEDYFGDDWINVWDSNYVTKVSLEDFTAEYDATISPVVIAEIYVVGLAIVALSIVIPSVMIMRFNPKKILMNQG